MSDGSVYISKGDMIRLAEHIEDYLEIFMEVFIIPDQLLNREDEIYDSIKTVKKLIKKLQRGDTSVFDDEEDIEFID